MKEAGSSDVVRENIMYRRPNDKNSNCLQSLTRKLWQGQENIRHCKSKEEKLYCPWSLTRQLWQEQESKMHCKSKEEKLYCPWSLTRQPQSAGGRIQHYRPDH